MGRSDEVHKISPALNMMGQSGEEHNMPELYKMGRWDVEHKMMGLCMTDR